jgi:hypothetical protein
VAALAGNAGKALIGHGDLSQFTATEHCHVIDAGLDTHYTENAEERGQKSCNWATVTAAKQATGLSGHLCTVI